MDRRTFIAGAASLALAPRSFAAVASGVPLALMTADLESRLVAVDLWTGRIRGYVATYPTPRSIEAVGDRAVVAHSEIGVISIVRAGTLRVAHALGGFGEPRYTAGHPDERHAYVTDAQRGEVITLDVLRGRVLARTSVGALARHIAIDPTGRTLWVALGSKAQEVAVIDISHPGKPRLGRRFRPPFLAHDVSWALDGKRAWVSSGDRNELAVYEARTGRLVSRPAADTPPQHITFKGDRAFVASGDSGTLRVHGRDGQLLRLTRIPAESYNIQHRYGWIVTPGLGTGTLCVLNRHGRVVHSTKVARSSHDACVFIVRAR